MYEFNVANLSVGIKIFKEKITRKNLENDG